jgi:acetyltransferase-like isoleucine patch superfamily enzyme
MIRKLHGWVRRVLHGKGKSLERHERLNRDRVRLGRNCSIGNNTTIGYGSGIGDGLYVGSGSNFPVSIGKYCAIAHNLRIRARNHRVDCANVNHRLATDLGIAIPEAAKRGVKVGNAVWIGDNVVILPALQLGMVLLSVLDQS